MIVIPAPTPAQEAEAVKETEQSCRQAEAKEGDKVYLVSNRWFTQWCQHTGFTWDPVRKRVTLTNLAEPGPRPGPIDSSDLVELGVPSSSGREPDLNEEERAQIVHLKDRPPPYFEVREPTWLLLKQWYGVVAPEVWLEMMQVGPAKRVETDLHPWHLKAVLEASEAEHRNKSAVVAVSKQCTVSDLKRRCCAALGVSEAEYDIMDFYGMEKAEKLEQKLFKTVNGANLQDQQAVMLRHKARVREMEEEEKEAAAAALTSSSSPPTLMMSTSPAFLGNSPVPSSPVPSSPLSRSMSKPPSWAEDLIQTSAARRRGLAGLGNLGNTCFMNSSVQCLAHTVPIMETFLAGSYKHDINADNPLGMGGKLANSFGSLMDKLWQGGVSSVSPKRFKWELARFAPQFQGYAQQDSQELLAFLLDGLHEDLNRIKNKPYIQEKDDDGRGDQDLAGEAWNNYRSRNDSVIVDHFQGLYKSTLVCPRCKHKSRKFDPFMYLTLPLPTAKTRAFTVVVLQVDGSAPPIQYSVEVPKTATIRQLCAALAKACGVEGDAPEQQLLLGQYTSSGLLSTKTEMFTDLEARVSSIKEPARSMFSSSPKSTLLAYRYPDGTSGPQAPGRKQVMVIHKSRGHVAGPAMSLFLTAEELGSVRLEACKSSSTFTSQEWVVNEPGSTLDAATKRLLRPFRRRQLESPLPSPPAAAAAARLAEADPMEDVATIYPAAADKPADGEGMMEEGEAEAMDLEQPDTPPVESFGDASPTSSGGGDTAMDPPATVGPQLPPSASSDQPFDMWARQAAPQPQLESAAAAQQHQHAQPKEPYRLKYAAGPEGRLCHVSDAEAAPDLTAEEGPLYFVADWNDEGTTAYNPNILESPTKHQSALDAEAATAAHGSRKVTLAECMETFLQPEQLDAEDSWYCSQCKEHVQADKKLDLWSLPEVLVVHLKRFSYSRYSRDKLDTHVDFPLEGLDLSRYLLPDQGSSCVYDLYAVSNHYGGLGGGHYTAYCKMPDDGKWYLFDDSSVKEAEGGSVISSAAYVLFYRRQGSKVDVSALLEQQHEQGVIAADMDASEAPTDPLESADFPIGSP